MKQYQSVELLIEYFESEDVITASPSGYDGTGEIPESWWNT